MTLTTTSSSSLTSSSFCPLPSSVSLPTPAPNRLLILYVVGWSGAYPVLSRKRPTASLVSRKVLTPLLGQIAICILIQLIGFEYVQRQAWYTPPVLDKDKSNSHNSENTTLFLVSCYQYILSAVVLSVGPPFRQSMAQNREFYIWCSSPITNNH